MGAVDLVVQIEAPPSVANAVQRIGRAGHHVGVPSEGIIFPNTVPTWWPAPLSPAQCTRAWSSRRVLAQSSGVSAQQIVAIVAATSRIPEIQALEDRATARHGDKQPWYWS